MPEKLRLQAAETEPKFKRNQPVFTIAPDYTIMVQYILGKSGNEAVVNNAPVDNATAVVEQFHKQTATGLRKLVSGALDSFRTRLNAYIAVEQRAEGVIRTLMDRSKLRTDSDQHGIQFGLECLRIVENAMTNNPANISERTRQDILNVIGQLVVATKWYHESNPTQEQV